MGKFGLCYEKRPSVGQTAPVETGSWRQMSEIRREIRQAKFRIGQVVRHRIYPFRGVIFDVDPVFANSEEWWLSIPEDLRPSKDQPFYHLYAENDETTYVAYVSEQNLLPDDSGQPVSHPDVMRLFEGPAEGRYYLRNPELH